MTKRALQSFRFLVKPPEEKPELVNQLVRNLGPHNAHLARGRNTRTFHQEPDGHYIVVATDQQTLQAVFSEISQAGFTFKEAHFPPEEDSQKTAVVSLFHLAARLT